ncbi:MAG: hypothetical protein HYZ01_05785 [Ignavibacteriales bacterium]|nr:hypothetical protein [Ignavibacteriales bacterium]
MDASIGPSGSVLPVFQDDRLTQRWQVEQKKEKSEEQKTPKEAYGFDSQLCWAEVDEADSTGANQL